MKQKFLILSIIDATAMMLAAIRSELNARGVTLYCELDNVFYISCNKSLKETLSKFLEEAQANYILAYTNSKIGCKLYAGGITDADRASLALIIEEKN